MDEVAGARVADLFNITPDFRTIENIQELSSLLLRTQIFESIAHQIDMQAAVECCARKMMVKRLPAHHTVFNCGDDGKEFYFIISGQASILVPYAVLLANSNKRRPSVVLSGMAQSVLTKSFLTKAFAKFQACNDPSAEIEVAVIGPGYSFGDLSLIRNIPRLLSVETTQETTLAYIGKLEFNKIMRKVQDRLFNEKVNFLGSLLPFKRLTARGLHRVAHCFHYKSYHKHEMIYSEGEPTDSVFVIISGEFEFAKTLKSNTDRLGQKPSLRRSITRKKLLRLFSKIPREFFGQEDLFENRARFATCTCMSPKGEVYYIEKTDFMTQVMTGSSATVFKSQHNLIETFQNDLLEKSANFERLLKSQNTEDQSGLPSLNTSRSAKRSLSPDSQTLTHAFTEDRLFPIREKLQIIRRGTIRRDIQSSENSQMHSESPLKQSSTEPRSLTFKSARVSVLRQRPEDTARLQESISEIRKSLVKTALKPVKFKSKVNKLRDRTFLRVKLESIERDSSIKKMLLNCRN